MQCTSGAIERLTQAAGKTADTRVIHWGVDPARFPVRLERPGPPKRLLFVGQVIEHKGVHTAIEACALLVAAGNSGKPILLKRGPSSTIEEWLLAAEYILTTGNPHVVLCERGIRSFDPMTRNVLDVSAIPLLRTLTHLPIVSDPSHGTGRRDLVAPMALASVAAGADGLIIEMHPRPDKSLSDAAQTVSPDALAEIIAGVRAIHAALGRPLNATRPQTAQATTA